jgi:hypothetical protein
MLEHRFQLARTIAGTHRLHCFVPLSAQLVEVRDFSSSLKKRVERISLTSDTTSTAIRITSVNGYVTAKYDGHWWLACVMQTMPDSNEVEVSFLYPHGPSKSFSYPDQSDVLVISAEDILTKVNPTTATGRVYAISPVEITTATRTLEERM